jgi:hypothetical protein
MNSPKSRPPMRPFHVQESLIPGGVGDIRKLYAAYYKSDGGFTTFKDADNQAVYSVRDDHVISIERVGLDDHLAELEGVLDLARRVNEATGSVRAETVLPDGSIGTEEFQVSIVLRSGYGTLPATCDPEGH